MSVASLLKTDKSSGENLFGAYVCDDETTAALVPVLAERDWVPSLIKSGGIENAIRTLATTGSPQFLIVDLSNSTDPMGDINALAEVCEPGTMVIAVGTENDVQLYRDLTGSGVLDYLIKPVTSDQLRETLLAAEHSLRVPDEVAATEEDDDTHKMVAVVGVRGGVGTTTIATNTAWTLGNELKKSTALLDMDIYFGTGALSFDLEPGRGLCDALENPSRVDGLFIERAMVKQSDHLSILGAEAPLNDPAYTDPAALSHLLSELKHNFQYVIMDLPRNMVADFPLLLTEANEIIVVSDLSLAATRDTIRLLSFCKAVAPETNIKIVVNKATSTDLAEVSQKDFAVSVERDIDWVIPLDHKLMIQVAKSGKPLCQVAKRSKIGTPLSSITEMITGKKGSAAKEPFWKKLSKPAEKKKAS